MNLYDQNPEELLNYQEIKSLQDKLFQAKRDYLKQLISLGYVFEQQGSYESTTYWAIHSDYYKIPEDRIWTDDIDGTSFPEFYPKGAFIVISSCCIDDNNDHYINASDFLDEDKCSIEYLRDCAT